MSHLISRGSMAWDELQEGAEAPVLRDARQVNGVWVATVVLTGETVEQELIDTFKEKNGG